jgi:hypothetical protein
MWLHELPSIPATSTGITELPNLRCDYEAGPLQGFDLGHTRCSRPSLCVCQLTRIKDGVACQLESTDADNRNRLLLLSDDGRLMRVNPCSLYLR